MARNILIVDDDQLMRRSLAFNLEQAGYRVKSAANAEDALEILRASIFDLVLLDIGLPGMDGLDAVRSIKDEFGLPVIFLTARRRELDEVVGLEMGADDYVTKPFDVDVLLARIKAVLRRSEAGEAEHAEADHTAGQRRLLQHFRSIEISVVGNLDLPDDIRDAWWADSMAMVRATR